MSCMVISIWSRLYTSKNTNNILTGDAMTHEYWHKDKIAIVTGGTSGIGLDIARVLKQRGATVVIGGRNPDQLSSLQDRGYLALQLDVCDTASVDAFVSQVTETYAAPDILVNSAGISVHHKVCSHTDDDWNAVIDTNLNGPFRMIRSCLPSMMESRWGRIVNIASTAATTAVATHAAYCASKSGLLGLTRSVALEGAPCGVTCTAVSPTWVETEMLRNSIAKMANSSGRSNEQVKSEIESSNPQNRLVQTSEIAELVSFLCSDLSPALTMEDIQVNAGAFW